MNVESPSRRPRRSQEHSDSSQQKTEELDRFFDLALELLCIADTDGYFRRLNLAWEKTLGYTRDELTARQFLDFVHPDDIASTLEAISALASQKEVIDFVNRYRCRDGSYRWIEWRSAPAGKLIYAAARDITERRHAEEQIRSLNKWLKQRTVELEVLNKELESFSYSVSHDLRAPLRNADGLSRALLEDYGDKLDGRAKEYLTGLRESCQLMNHLVEDLLSLSRVAMADMRIEKVDLSALVRSIVIGLQKLQPDREADFTIADGLVAEGDYRLLRIALENLLSNAWKFTGKQSSTLIEFGWATSDGKKAFFVRDNGVGFDMAYASKLFIPFQRLHSEAEFPGIGIGLATVQRIVHRHGGKVWAEGEVEKGATFYFTLELEKEAAT